MLPIIIILSLDCKSFTMCCTLIAIRHPTTYKFHLLQKSWQLPSYVEGLAGAAIIDELPFLLIK